MALSVLNFTESTTNPQSQWEASFVSDGITKVIEVEREASSYFTIYANLDGMTPISIANEPKAGRKDLIFQVDVPDGVTVTLVSYSPVISAKMQ